MDASKTKAMLRCRLGIAGVLLVALFFVTQRLAVWRNIERETYLQLAASGLAVAILVIVAPILWRGDWVQRLLAAVLCVLPVLCLLGLVR